MKIRFTPMFVALIAGLAFSSAAALAQSADQPDRVAASFMLALGRAPSANETEQWTKLGSLSIADLVARHRQDLASNTATRRSVVVQAGQDAFGRAPTDDEIKNWSATISTYTELMQRHIAWLGEHTADYEQVQHRAYRLLVRRDAYVEEIAYWKQRDTLSFALLVGCIEDWARRNQPGLMITSGTPTVSVNSNFLTTVRLSPAIAAEARVAVGLAEASTGPQELNPGAYGRNLVAAGAGQIITGGRICFVAAGAGNLVPGRAESM